MTADPIRTPMISCSSQVKGVILGAGGGGGLCSGVGGRTPGVAWETCVETTLLLAPICNLTLQLHAGQIAAHTHAGIGQKKHNQLNICREEDISRIHALNAKKDKASKH